MADRSLGCGFAIVFLSFVPITGDGGMISLAQAAFVGVGAVTAAKLSTEHGVSPLAAVLIAGLVTAAVGLVVALPALRLSDVYLALATFAFGLFMDNLIFPLKSISFDQSGFFGLTMPHLEVFGWHVDDEQAFVLAALGVFVILALLVRLDAPFDTRSEPHRSAMVAERRRDVRSFRWSARSWRRSPSPRS